MLTGVMYEKINSMNEPAVLCDSSYKIVWANRFVHESTSDGVIGTSVQLLFDYKIKDGEIGKRPVDTIVPFRGRSYIVEEEPIKDYEKSNLRAYSRSFATSGSDPRTILAVTHDGKLLLMTHSVVEILVV